MKEIITKNAAKTQQFAKEFASRIQPGDVITLSGDLGAGKTTFTQGFAQGLGITQRIISPTFIIVRSYRIKNLPAGRVRQDQDLRLKNFYHIDLYRVRNENDLLGLGLMEILQEKDAIVVIEWPEKMGALLPEKRWDIKIETVGDSERKISLKMTIPNA